jgi:hypothetical protein
MGRISRWLGPTKVIEDTVPALTIRYAAEGDAEAITGLAQLDSSRPPRGLVLVAEVQGRLWAAISLDDHHAVADPFRPTSELVLLLTERARQLRRAHKGRTHGLPRVWPSAPIDGVDPRRTALG